MESQKPCKYRFRDSERLLLILGRKVSGTQRSDKRLAIGGAGCGKAARPDLLDPAKNISMVGGVFL